MKMIVSDYDGTIKRFLENPNFFKRFDFDKDLRSIKKFINDGNTFVISTKRTTPSMTKEIERYHLEYSYLTTHEGLVTFDRKGNLIYANYLNSELISIINMLKEKESVFGRIVSFDESHMIDSISKSNLVLIGMQVYNLNEALNYLKAYGIDLDSIHTSYKGGKLWIHNKIDKRVGIEQLVEFLPSSEKPSEIIPISDAIEDIEMINEYNGWCIDHSELANYNSEINCIPNIRRLIKKLK